jgi:hypothetical protein
LSSSFVPAMICAKVVYCDPPHGVGARTARAYARLDRIVRRWESTRAGRGRAPLRRLRGSLSHHKALAKLRSDESDAAERFARLIVTLLEEPLYRAGALAGMLAAQRKCPGHSWTARESVGQARRLCAEVRRRSRGKRSL